MRKIFDNKSNNYNILDKNWNFYIFIFLILIKKKYFFINEIF